MYNEQNMNNSFQNNNVMYNPMVNNVPKKNNLWLIIGVVFLIVIVVVIILSATGVLGGKSLTCVNNVESYGVYEEDKIRIYYDDSDHPTKMVVTIKATITEDSKFTVDYLKKAFDIKADSYEEIGASVLVNSNENSVTYTITIGKDNIEAAFDMIDSSYDSQKKFYEKSGFTCN